MSAQNKARRARFRDQLSVFINDVAFHIADCPATMGDPAFRSQFRFPHWPDKIDLQLHRRKRFARFQRACKRDSHRSVRDVAQNAAVNCAHWVCMLRPGLQYNQRAAISMVRHFKPNQPRGRRSRLADVFRQSSVFSRRRFHKNPFLNFNEQQRAVAISNSGASHPRDKASQ